MKKEPKVIKTEYVVKKGEQVIGVFDTLKGARKSLWEVTPELGHPLQITRQNIVETVLDVYEAKQVVAWAVSDLDSGMSEE